MFKQITKTKTPKKAKIWVCAHCGKKVGSEQGLKAHCTRMHYHTNDNPSPSDNKILELELGTGVEQEAIVVMDKLVKMRASLVSQIESMENEKLELDHALNTLGRYLKGE